MVHRGQRGPRERTDGFAAGARPEARKANGVADAHAGALGPHAGLDA